MTSNVTQKDLTINQGSQYVHVFTYIDQAAGVPENINGYIARMQIRSNHGSNTVLYDSTTGVDIAITDGANGIFKLTIPTVTTSGFSFSKAVYDIELVDPTGEATRVVEGAVFVSPEVTR